MKSKEQYCLRFSMKAEEGSDDAEVMVYSDIASDKFWGDECTSKEFDTALKDAKKKGAKNLNLRINSPGGEVYAAVAMRSMVINSGFENVRVMVEGLCASAATLFATIPGAHVVIAEGSEFMIHNPMTIAWGNAAELEQTVDHLHKLEDQFHGMYAAKTGQTEDQIKEWMDATTWFTAKEAVENGFCDELLEGQKVAACVSPHDMDLMKSIYAVVPDEINVSNGVPAQAGDPSEDTEVLLSKSEKEEDAEMAKELKDITAEELRAENPALFDQIRQEAVEAERERLNEIDALTGPGYEDLAEQAKADGTSAMDFYKQIVAAQKKKGEEFIQARQQETAPAAEVAGGAPEDSSRNEEQEISDYAQSMAEYAKQAAAMGDGMF